MSREPRWRVVDLGAPPSAFEHGFSATHVSNLGLSVGQARINGFTSAVAVSSAGVYTQLRAVTGDVVALPYSVNSFGTAVGTSSADRRYESRVAVVWNRDGAPEVIPGLGRSEFEETIAINDVGVMAGYTAALEPEGSGSGFVWHKSWPAPVKLEKRSTAEFSTPIDINIAGQIVGHEGTALVLWDLRGRITSFVRPDGYSSPTPRAINDFGVVAGQVFPNDAPAGDRAVFTWSKRTGFVILPPPAGFTNPFVYGIDNLGRVYGGVEQDGVVRPIIWVAGVPSFIAPIDGGSVGSGSVYAVSQTGIMSGTLTVNGVSHPTIWVPRR